MAKKAKRARKMNPRRGYRRNPQTPVDAPLMKRAQAAVPAMAVGVALSLLADYGAGKIPDLSDNVRDAIVAAVGVGGAIGLHAAGQDRAGLAFGGATLAVVGTRALPRIKAMLDQRTATRSTGALYYDRASLPSGAVAGDYETGVNSTQYVPAMG